MKWNHKVYNELYIFLKNWLLNSLTFSIEIYKIEAGIWILLIGLNTRLFNLKLEFPPRLTACK